MNVLGKEPCDSLIGCEVLDWSLGVKLSLKEHAAVAYIFRWWKKKERSDLEKALSVVREIKKAYEAAHMPNMWGECVNSPSKEASFYQERQDRVIEEAVKFRDATLLGDTETILFGLLAAWKDAADLEESIKLMEKLLVNKNKKGG